MVVESVRIAAVVSLIIEVVRLLIASGLRLSTKDYSNAATVRIICIVMNHFKYHWC